MSFQTELRVWTVAVGPSGWLVVATSVAIAVGYLIVLYL